MIPARVADPSHAAAVLVLAAFTSCGAHPGASAATDAGPTLIECGEPRSASDGDNCVCDSDCQADAFCSTESSRGEPRGMCIRLCDKAGTIECNDGFICVESARLRIGYCAQACGAQSDCAPGRVCTNGACEPFCSENSECASGVCDPYIALCKSSRKRGEKGLYRTCRDDSDCKSGFCNPIGKRCTSSCRTDDNFCPESGVCISVNAGEQVGLCYPPCTRNRCGDESLQCAVIGINFEPACAFPRPNSVCLDATANRKYGSDCGCPGDCPDDAACVSEEFSGDPGGVCLKQCRSNVDCGTDGLCIANQCSARCGTDSDCGIGLCDSSSGVCLSFCESDSVCSSSCNMESGRCATSFDSSSEQASLVGEICDDPAACASHQCMMLASSYGYCSRFCDVRTQACPDNAVCAPLDDGHLGFCTRRCAEDAECGGRALRCIASDIGGYCSS